MPRSTSVWAAALLLASFTGSGPILTTAEAMPAPGPMQTQAKPRYYFPRHVKRQIVTNVTAPAVPTSSPSSSSSSSASSEKLESRQFPDFLSFVFGGNSDTSSGQDIRKSDFDSASTLTSTRDVIVTTTSELPAGTGDLQPPPVVSSALPSSSEDADTSVPPPSSSRLDSSSDRSDAIVLPPVATPVPETPSQAPQETPALDSPAFAPTGSMPSSPIQPTTTPTPEPVVEPEPVVISSSTPAASPEPLLPLLPSLDLGLPSLIVPVSSAPASRSIAPTGEFPQIVIPSSTPAVAPTGELPTPVASSAPDVASPSPSAPSEEPVGGVLSSLLAPLVPSTGAPVPSEVIQPTPAPVESVQPSSAPDSSSFLGPFIIPGSSDVVPPASSSGPLAGILPSLIVPIQVTPTGAVGTGDVSIPVVLPTSAPAVSEPQPNLSLPASGIVIGITTAFGTGEVPTPTAPALSSGAIPTSETGPASSGLLDLPPVLSSIVSELPGILPSSGLLGGTAPTPAPSAVPSGILPPVVSSVISDLPGFLSSAVSDVPPSVGPTAPVSIAPPSSLPSLLPSEALPSGILPSSGVVPTGAVSSGLLPSLAPSSGVLPTPSETLSVVPSLSSGILPSGSAGPTGSIGSSVSPAPTPSPSGSLSVPASEQPPSSSASAILSSISLTPPTSINTTVSDAPTPSVTPSASAIPSKSDSATISIPTIATTTSKPAPVVSQSATATDSATSLVIGTSIIMEPSTASTPSPTSSGIPSSLPKMIAPPDGIPPQVPQDSFMGQVCFKWPLNYPFVSANDGGKQIFHYLPQAIADGLGIPIGEVKNMGLKPLDTTAYQGFITTLALFTIPSDLQDTLAVMLRNPAAKFWHNTDSTVNDLTSQINTACPLPAAGGESNAPNEAANPAATPGGGAGDGGAIGGDIGASRKVNSTSAIVASSAIVGAFAYGAAMFFVARRYRNKRIAHQRASSVPSTSRMTYGSIPGGAAAWMHGARNGRMTPGSRGSRGSSSSQGRSVRTAQISAPVMAENSLGWN